MKRLPSIELEEALADIFGGTRVRARLSAKLSSAGLIVRSSDLDAGYELTDSGYEYLFRIKPGFYGKWKPGGDSSPVPYGEEATREKFIEEWGPLEFGDVREFHIGDKYHQHEEWAEKIRESPEPLENVDMKLLE